MFCCGCCFSNLYTHCGAWIHDPKIKNHILFPMSQPGAPKTCFLNLTSSTVYLFVFILRERLESKWGRGKERGRQKPKQAVHCQRRARCPAWTPEPWDHDLSRNQELDASQLSLLLLNISLFLLHIHIVVCWMYVFNHSHLKTFHQFSVVFTSNI